MAFFKKSGDLDSLQADPSTVAHCPYCDAEVDRLRWKGVAGAAGDAKAWLCPACSRILGVSSRR